MTITASERNMRLPQVGPGLGDILRLSMNMPGEVSLAWPSTIKLRMPMWHLSTRPRSEWIALDEVESLAILQYGAVI